jgi:3',5'-cyclic AMP phosphodiesterase CpdA
MRTIVHLSDLHFGALDTRLLAPLADEIRAVRPDLIAVSGDLTQRARRSQFTEARQFLDSLPFPRLVVPGNHDVPLFDLPRRLFNPLGRYRRHITSNLSPVFADAELLVVGLNSTRALSFAHGPGRLNPPQILAATARLNLAPLDRVKIVVTHHPFDLPAGHEERQRIGRADLAMSWLARVRVDLFLAGHLHVTHIGDTAARYRIAGHSAVIVQAGTLSRRGRGEASSFNVLHVDWTRVVIERRQWSPDTRRFTRQEAGAFARTEAGWRPLEQARHTVAPIAAALSASARTRGER